MSYKMKLLLPTLVANAALMAYLMLAWVPEYAADADEATTQLLAPLLLWLTAGAAGLWGGLTYLHHRLQGLERQARAVAHGSFQFEPWSGGRKDAFDQCAAQIGNLHVLLRQKQSALERESNLLQQCEQNLRDSEERYVVAIRNANDGAMEWDLAENHIHYSPRWKSMLGLDDAEIGNHADAWYSRIHRDDYERIKSAVQTLVEGRATLFEDEHRMRHGNGDYIWVAARGVVVRSASGKPVKLICALTDITEKKLVHQLLSDIEQGLDSVTGDEFFRLLVQNMARALDARYSFITECLNNHEGNPDRVRTIAFWAEGGFTENIEYDLEGTPCQEVIENGLSSFYPAGLAQHFPREAGLESYIGIPVFGENGRVVGHIACLDSAPLRNGMPIAAIQKLFAVRASTEIIRMSLQKSLHVAQQVIRTLSDNVDEIVMLADAEGKLESINSQAMKLCGLHLTDIAGQTMDQLLATPEMHSTDQTAAPVAPVAGSGEGNTRIFCLHGLGGKAHQIQGNISSIYDEHQRLAKIVIIGKATNGIP